MTVQQKPLVLLATLVLLAACDDVGAGAERLREQGAKAMEQFEAQRERVEAELERRLQEASAELEQLKGASEERLESLQRELEAQRVVARAKLAELRSAGEEAWEGALEDARREVDKLTQGAAGAPSGG